MYQWDFASYEITIVEETTEKGIKLDINALSAIMLGYKRPLELNELELINGSEEKYERLKKIVPVREAFIYRFLLKNRAVPNQILGQLSLEHRFLSVS